MKFYPSLSESIAMDNLLYFFLILFPALYIFFAIITFVFRKSVGGIRKDENHLPYVSFIISSAGEDIAVLQSKIENTFRLDYPLEKLEIILFSDGFALDFTRLSHSRDRIKFMSFKKLGKTECQNRCVDMANGEIIVLTDVTVLLKNDAVLKTVRWYADSRVGSVGGHFQYYFNAANVERDYMKSELEGKARQSRYGFVIGYLGPVYSFRKDCYRAMPSFYSSDYVLPLSVYLQGRLSIHDAEIVSYRSLDRTIEREFHRKRRIISQGIATTLHFLWEHKQKMLAKPAFLSAILTKKFLRWFIMPYLVFAYFSLYCFDFYFTEVTAVLSIIALTSTILYKTGSRNKYLISPYYWLTIFAANILAIMDVVMGRRYVMWRPGSS